MRYLRRKALVGFLVLMMSLTLLVGAAGAESDRQSLFARIQSIFETVEAYHVAPVDAQTFVEGAIRGGLESLNDPYTNYFSPPEFQAFLNSLSGEVTGIGVYLDLDGGYVIVASPIKGSPAFAAGLRTGDRILEADGQSLVPGTIEKAQRLIRGEPGTKVKLKIERPAESRTFEVTITRARIQIPVVEYKMLEGSVGYLQLYSFGDRATSEFFAGVKALKAEGATSLVLDLRQNPGGYVNDAIAIASAFVPKGEPIMHELRKDGAVVMNSTGTLINLPVVVLVDGGTASASEIVAGAIQDHGVGKLVGTTTFGKGSVQQILFMLDGAGMKVTIAEYLTAKRRQVHGKGLQPDLMVGPAELPEGLEKPLQLKRLLTANMLGLDVLQVQQRLTFLGYQTGVEGLLDQVTLAELQRFARDQNLQASMAVDNTLVKRLNEQVELKLKGLREVDRPLQKAVELLRK